jgi:hypothetical protein
MAQGSNPDGGEIFCTCTDWPWGPSSLLYNGYWIFPGATWLGHGIDHPPLSNTEVKERVELYLCSPSGPLWPFLDWTLPLPYCSQLDSIIVWSMFGPVWLTAVHVNLLNIFLWQVMSMYGTFSMCKPPNSISALWDFCPCRLTHLLYTICVS